jgi:uncharacterized protein (TIGR03435 family)
LVAVALTVPLCAQSAAPAYDVVSIKPNKSGSGMMRTMNAADGFSGENVSLKMLMQGAYDLKTDDQLVGLPGWGESANFDVQAKMDADTVAELKKLSEDGMVAERRAMMQTLLVERFHLKLHHETRDLPMYALTVAKSGFKLKEAVPDGSPDSKRRPGTMTVGRGTYSAVAIPMSNLALILGYQVHRLVVDRTGLSGQYDVALKWSPEDGANSATDSPSLFVALEEQLGLKLDSTKGPVDVIVVDHAEMPAVDR